jgi:spore coat polysaccharide biosynthesis protein SpsF (cytidylyltransferase family)
MSLVWNSVDLYGETTMSILIVIQARMGSTRLPAKVLLHLYGKPILQHVIDACQYDDEWKHIVALPDTAADRELAQMFLCTHVSSCEDKDVLGRYCEVAKEYDRSTVVRLTADCPMLTGEIIEDVIEQHMASQSDFTYNSDSEQGDGIDVEAMKLSVLKECCEQAISIYDREHVTSWIRNNPKFKKLKVSVPDYPTRSINTLDDYVWVHQHWRKE